MQDNEIDLDIFNLQEKMNEKLASRQNKILELNTNNIALRQTISNLKKKAKKKK